MLDKRLCHRLALCAVLLLGASLRADEVETDDLHAAASNQLAADRFARSLEMGVSEADSQEMEAALFWFSVVDDPRSAIDINVSRAGLSFGPIRMTWDDADTLHDVAKDVLSRLGAERETKDDLLKSLGILKLGAAIRAEGTATPEHRGGWTLGFALEASALEELAEWAQDNGNSPLQRKYEQATEEVEAAFDAFMERHVLGE